MPRWPPAGAVIEHAAPFVRTHYGPHGTVGHGPLPRSPGAATVRRQPEACAARNEPVEWKVHGNDAPEPADALTAAGFGAGAECALRTLTVFKAALLAAAEGRLTALLGEPLRRRDRRRVRARTYKTHSARSA
ncbi:hypothetical protein [Streptomyces sp. NPDC090021]|uniref:hypothetical protein n=1 Tax=Streptomyces sp. NPDC090021 TaxID=3365919 RepID=UPI0037F378D1